MPSTRTKSNSRTRATIVLDPEEVEVSGLELGERSAGAERSELDERAQRAGGRAQRGAGGTLRAAAEGPELSPELVDDAVNRARVRRAVGRLPDGGRVSDEVIDELLGGARTEEEIVGPGGLLAQLTKRLVERALRAELTEHLGLLPRARRHARGLRRAVGIALPVITQAWPNAWEYVIPFLPSPTRCAGSSIRRMPSRR